MWVCRKIWYPVHYSIICSMNTAVWGTPRLPVFKHTRMAIRVETYVCICSNYTRIIIYYILVKLPQISIREII